jgi:hypothetical protein
MAGALEAEGNSNRIFIHLPQDNHDTSRAYQDEYSPGIRAKHLSITALRVAALTASGDDFRWSMTQSELAQHRELIYHKMSTASSMFERVETWENDHNIQGLIQVINDSAWVEW